MNLASSKSGGQSVPALASVHSQSRPNSKAANTAAKEAFARYRSGDGSNEESTDKLPVSSKRNAKGSPQSLRERGRAGFLRTGFPGKKNEGWQFSPLEKISAHTKPAGAAKTGTTAGSVPDFGLAKVVLSNGYVDANELAAQSPAGFSFKIQKPGDSQGVLSGDSAAPMEWFSGLNAAMAESVLRIEVAPGAKDALHLAHLFSPTAANGADREIAYPRIEIVVAKGAECTIVESSTWLAGASVLGNTVVEVHLLEGARLEHVRLSICDDGSQQESKEGGKALSLATIAVHQERDSYYGGRQVTLGGSLVRTETHVVMAGPGAECDLDGVYLADSGEHVAQQIWVEHRAPHCTSHQRFRGVLDGSGHGVFDGMAFVRKDAQRSEAHQENRNLLLSDKATINTKPHLEIEADDVSCSHGATVGSLEPEQQFYLRTRGIGEDEANAILTFSFLEEILEKITLRSVKEFAAKEVLARLPEGHRVGEIVMGPEEL